VEKFIATSIHEFLNEQITSNKLDVKIKCIQATLKQELDKYNNKNYDDRWADIRQELRRIESYFEDGYFFANKDDEKYQMLDFLKNLNYSDNLTYKKGKKIRMLPNSNIPVYRATGNKTLFRGVSLKDWDRIKNQGFIDSDMRSAIFETEGINLGQTPNEASYYLPHNEEGVILAVSPKNLDLYMLDDEYIRVFEPIPIKNIIKVSSVFLKNKTGGILTTNTEGKINDMITRLKTINVDVNC
jgi:hypothetical protein